MLLLARKYFHVPPPREGFFGGGGTRIDIPNFQLKVSWLLLVLYISQERLFSDRKKKKKRKDEEEMNDELNGVDGMGRDFCGCLIVTGR